jgi:DNA replication initiation complex subunit (GINS family)
MIVFADKNSKIFEIDKELFEEVKNFLKNLSKQKNKAFSYIDEFGDKVVVIGDEEYVVPTNEDIQAILLSKKDEFLDEDEVKSILNV